MRRLRSDSKLNKPVPAPKSAEQLARAGGEGASTGEEAGIAVHEGEGIAGSEVFEGASPDEVLVGGARSGSMEMVEEALANGAKLNTRDGVKNTAVHYAAMLGHEEIILRLAEAGEDGPPFLNTNLKNYNGETPLVLASAEGHYGAVAALLQAGADPEIRSGDGDAPAEVAATDEIYELIQQARVAAQIPDSAIAEEESDYDSDD